MTSQAEALLEADVPKPKARKIEQILLDAAGYEALFRIRIGDLITNQVAVSWAHQLSIIPELRKDPVASAANLQDTFLQYVGTRVDDRLARVLARQLAARHDELDKGLLAAYVSPSVAEWIYVEISAIKPATWRDGRPAAVLLLDALTGRPAGNVLRLKVLQSWLAFLAYKIGFSRKLRYNDEPRLLIGLRFMSYLLPSPPDSTDATFKAWFINPDLKKHNAPIIRLRTRFDRDDNDCPDLREHDCWDCDQEVGKCPASFLRGQID